MSWRILNPSCLGFSDMADSLTAAVPRLSRSTVFFRIAVLAALLVAGGACGGCRRERPYGLQRLGRVADLQAPETYFQDKNILLLHDADGFAAISTMCTYDLTPLVRQETNTGCIWASAYSESKYECRGKVLSGPTRYDLPYYEVLLEPGEYGGAPDSLYVWIAKNKPPAWRLKVSAPR
jgi:hypothetical protein